MIDVPLPQLVVEAEKVRTRMVSERDDWASERAALATPKVPSALQIEHELTGEAAHIRALTKARVARTEERVKCVRSKRLQLVQWVRNPARMIRAKHAELNAIARARAEARRAELGVRVRQDWSRSLQGQAFIAARRQPGLERAVETARHRRTLERKISRADKRIVTATRTLGGLCVVQELGQRSLSVPNKSPDDTRFFRDVGTPAREAVLQFPLPARQQAIELLNRNPGRVISRAFIPGLQGNRRPPRPRQAGQNPVLLDCPFLFQATVAASYSRAVAGRNEARKASLPIPILHSSYTGNFRPMLVNNINTIRPYDLPNGEIYTTAVMVNTAFDARRSQYDVGIGYGDDIAKASRIMLNAMSEVESVLASPAPDVVVADLAGSSINLRARWWTAVPRGDVIEVKSQVLTALRAALTKAQVDLPFPTQVVLFHDQTDGDDGDRTRQREGWPAGDNPPAPRTRGAEFSPTQTKA